MKKGVADFAAWLETNTGRRTAYVLVLAAVFLAWLSLCIVFRVGSPVPDPLASHWNDELGYQRAAQTLADYGKAVGMGGFNEQDTEFPKLSAWSPAAFWPYAALEWVTGQTQPGAVLWFNVFFTLVALAVLLWLMRPNGCQALCLAAFLCVCPIYTRYIWSCMAEAWLVAGTLVFAALVWWAKDHPMHRAANAALLFAVLLAGAMGLVRIYTVALALLPLFALLCKRRYGWAGAGFAACIATGLGYLRLSREMAAYFPGYSGPQTGMELLKSMDVLGLVRLAWEKNAQALAELKAGLFAGEPYACVVLLTLLIWICVLCAAIHRARTKQTSWLYWLYLIVTAVLYEALVVFYTVMQSHRHLLGMFVMGVVLLLFSQPLRKNLALLVLIPAVMVGSLRMQGLLDLKPAVSSVQTSALRSQLTPAFQDLLQVDPQDPWGNTVAWDLNLQSWQPLLLLPSGMAVNNTDYTYLAPAIRDRILKSRYVYTAPGLAADEACRNNGYPLLLEGEGFTLYENTDYQRSAPVFRQA